VVNDLNQDRFVAQFHFAATANLFTTPGVFDRVGLFDPVLLSGGDLEWGQRAWSLGVKQIYADNVVVRHPARASWRSLVAKTRRIAGGHYVQNRGAARPLLTTLALTLRIAAASLRRSWQDARLPTSICRLQVVVIDLALRFLQVLEVFRLHFGGRPTRC
jgi:GT2 family glycosyltransferase